MRVSVSPQTETDLDNIWLYIASEGGSADVADRVLDGIGSVLDVLRRVPYLGRDRSSDLRAGLRSFPSGNYVIFYQIDAGTVQVLRVLHGNRDLQSLLSGH